MKDIVKAILRSLGVDVAGVESYRIHKDLGNNVMVPTNGWMMVFVHDGLLIELELSKLDTKDSYMSFYGYDDGRLVKQHKEELADITAEDLREVIKDFIEG